MKISMKQAILATVSYRGIFDYPLTRGEVYDWLVKLKGKKEFESALKILIRAGKLFSVDSGGEQWITSTRQTDAIALRHSRALISQAKWSRANRISRLLSFVPTVSFIGVTGGLSVNNVDEGDDIDFFLIIEPGTIWISRFCVVLLTELFGVRRRPGATQVKDTICLNFFLTRDHPALTTPDRDIFSAYEILQCVPLFDTGGVYKEFLEANSWVKIFLPNAWKRKHGDPRSKIPDPRKKAEEQREIGAAVMKIFEYPAKILQRWYMRNRRTIEVVSDTTLRFHPRDMRVIVKKELAKRLKRYDIPLDTIFYSI